MSIVEGLKAEVKGLLARWGITHEAWRQISRAIDEYFEGFEERVMYRSRENELLKGDFLSPVNSIGWRYPTSVLIRKPPAPPEMVTLPREAVAVLAEHYEDTPRKDESGDRALAEAQKVL